MGGWHDIRWGALVMGICVDISGTVISVLAMGFIAGIVSAASGVPLEQLERIAVQSAPIAFLYFAVGLAWTTTGAAIAAYLSRPYSVYNAALYGIVQTALSVFLIGSLTTWTSIVSLALVMPVSVLAGWLVRRCDTATPEEGLA